MRDQELVSRSTFIRCVNEIYEHRFCSLDTETTGLYPYHGDRPFSVAISTKDKDYYFNWQSYEGLPSDLILESNNWKDLEGLTREGFWFVHNAKFDMGMMNNFGVSEWNNILCTKVSGRLSHNDLMSYSLDARGSRIGVKKDDTVKNYIKEHKLYEQREREGKSWKQPRFDLVPFEMISKYAMRDAYVCLKLGLQDIEKLKLRTKRSAQNLPPATRVLENELKLTKVLFDMEKTGAQIDVSYCRRAKNHYSAEMKKAKEEFLKLTGVELVLSSKCLSEVFQSEKDKFVKSPKSGYKFDGDILAKFENPAAKSALLYKDAKANFDFYQGFLFSADKDGVMHTTLDSGGTRTGRFSSYNPNLQNMTKQTGERLKEEFVVRRVIIPRKGFFLVMIDYDQIEYRLMLEYARAMGLIDKVLGGLDVHTATAESAGCTRSAAKTVNFLTLYGGGKEKLAAGLKTSVQEAVRIQETIFNAAPEIKTFINNCVNQARNKRKITNWLGRTYFFDNKNFCYKAPNTLIQGGAGDVVKVAMVNVYEFLKDKKSRMILNVHDELIFEIHESEENILPEIKEIMEKAYPHKYLPLTCGIEFSKQSLADKEEWRP